MKKQKLIHKTQAVEEINIVNTIVKPISIWAQHTLALMIIFISSLLLYANTATHDFALDDQLAIYDNTFVVKGVSGIKEIITNDAFVGFFGERGSKLISGGRYRPLSFVSFAIEWELFGRNPMVNHLVNILIYGLLCCGIYLFLVWLFPPKSENKSRFPFLYTLPFIATIIYTFHPIHTEVVANIKGRDELLCFLFSILTLIYIFQIAKNRLLDILMTSILFFCALMSKENAITFLAIIPLVVFFKGDFKEKKSIYIVNFLVVFWVTLFFVFLRYKFTSSGLDAHTEEILNNPFLRANDSERWGTIIYSFYRYFALLIFPNALTHDYYFNQIPYRDLGRPIVLATILGVVGMVYALVKTLKSRHEVAFSIIFFIATFSIVSNVFFTVGIIMNERFVFISSLGFCIILASLFLKFKLNNQARIIVLSVFLILFGLKVVTRNMDWKDNYTLFTADYTTSNQSAKVSTALGGVLMEKANEVQKTDTNLYKILVDSSIQVLRNSMSIYPENSQSILLYGNSMYAKNKNILEAINIYQEAIKFRPGGYFDALFNIGILYYNQGTYDSSMVYIEKAYKSKPDHKECKEMLAKLYAKFGRTNDAVKLTGGNSSSLGDLAMDAKDGGNYTEAISLADQALAVNPADAKANFVKGICYSRFLNRIAEGIPYLEKATSLEPKNGFWLEDLAVAYGMSGQFAKTIPILEKVIALRPNEPAGYRNLATSYANMGNQAKAQYYMSLASQKTGRR